MNKNRKISQEEMKDADLSCTGQSFEQSGRFSYGENRIFMESKGC